MTESILEQGKTLELHLIDGKPGGMLTAELFNWTGRVLVMPKHKKDKALEWLKINKEKDRTGVYLLLGKGVSKQNDKEDNGNKAFQPEVYIGETDAIWERLRQHENDKKKQDWWNRWSSIIIITDVGQRLNKAHVKYLESHLYEIVEERGSVKLDQNIPSAARLSKAQEANMEEFLEKLQLVLGLIVPSIIGVDIIETKEEPLDPILGEKESPIFELIPRRGDGNYQATAKIVGSNFVVENGSIVRDEWIGKNKQASSKKLRERLKIEGILVLVRDEENTESWRFSRDHPFDSISAAAEVVVGRAASGPKTWCVQGSKKTYEVWKKEQSPEK